MGLRRMVLPHHWVVFAAVTTASVVAACSLTHSLVGRLFRRLMPRRGVVPLPRQELLSTDPDRSRQSILLPKASCPAPRECCTPLEAPGPKIGAPSPARFVGHPTFRHPTFDSKHEILSIFPIGPRLTPRLQKPLGRTVRPVLGRAPLGRHARTRAVPLAENPLLLHRVQEIGASAATERNSCAAVV